MPQRRTRLLDLDKIVDAAIELTAERGRFTMPELALRLGVSVSSIYHHVSGRAALVERIRDRVSAPVDVALLDVNDWEQAVADWLTNCREAFARHPELVPLLAGPQTDSSCISQGHDRLQLALDNAGFQPDQAQLWISVLDSYGVGAALDLAAELDVRSEAALAALARRARGREHTDLAFEMGVRAILDGMRVSLAGAS
jgi:AcrR family transcriptional regulator